ncbi:hypothetical protein WJ972_15395 [Achromobacter insuavis]
MMNFFPALSNAVIRNGQLLIWANGNESQPNPYLLAGAPYRAAARTRLADGDPGAGRRQPRDMVERLRGGG